MIAKPMSTVLLAYRYARRGEWRKVRALLGPPRRYWNGKLIADRWLEYVYGWLPLMGDVYNSSQALSNILGSEGNTLSAQSSESAKGTYEFIDPSGNFTGSYEMSYKVRCGLTATVSSEFLAGANALGVTNPLAIGWDLIPFSFVVDWFVPVGNVLEACSAYLGLQPANGYKTGVMEIKKVSRHNGGGYTSPVNQHGHWESVHVVERGNLTVETKLFNRIAILGFPTPQLYGSKNPLSDGHVLNALALLRQLL
jgi:hypothetical protein